LIHRFADAPPETCRACGAGPVRRLLSAPAIQFKGSGWYITDYARKGKSENASGSPASDSKGGSASNGGSGDAAKPAAPTTTTTESKPTSSESK
jgi:predicted nucleic acid-binding Zn ribbon protein